MNNLLPTFDSPIDFFRRLRAVFAGPTFFSCFTKIDPAFREKLLLTVSMANNCAG